MIENVCGEIKANLCATLIDTGCCKRCALRFLGNLLNYDNPEDAAEFDNVITKNHNGSDEHTLKKLKLNPCVVCLDLLQDSSLEAMLLTSELNEILQYDCDTFINYISFPMSVLIREHAMEIYMKEKFPEFFEDHHIAPINRAWSLSIQKKLAKILNKKYDKNSYLSVQFTTVYELEEEEASIMHQLEEEVNNKNVTLSRNAIGEFLKTITSDIFRKHVSVPPQMPGKAVVLNSVTYKHEPIFIAGRYCKYSRNLGQTPWILDNVRIVENSVQEIIFKSLDDIFKCNNLVFSSSGREDFDVRTLGRGRPFFIKICDPKVTKVSFEEFRLIEKAVKKRKLVQVRDLQFIDRKYLNNIKEGEQFKQKTYRALCIVNKPEVLPSYIDKINDISSLQLEQKTPIRVYHRRSSDIRKRMIYRMEARTIAGRNNLFELDMITQAGTYVKEFVHGDFGRTKPSLSELIGGHVDIVTLDVLDIHLDFPPPINSNALKNHVV